MCVTGTDQSCSGDCLSDRGASASAADCSRNDSHWTQPCHHGAPQPPLSGVGHQGRGGEMGRKWRKGGEEEEEEGGEKREGRERGGRIKELEKWQNKQEKESRN